MKIGKIGMIGALTVLLTAPVAGVPAWAGSPSAQNPSITSASPTAALSQGNLTNTDLVVLFKNWFGFQVNFVVPPKAGDFFERVQDGQWYTQAFLDCKLSGVDLPKNIDPQGFVTREQFAHYLRTALAAKGVDPVVPLLYRLFRDGDQIDPGYQSDIQFLTYFGVMPVEGNLVRPKDPVTRGSAATMLSRAALLWLNPDGTWKSGSPAGQPDGSADEISVDVQPVNDNLNKVTLTWGEKPNGCYSLEITGIRFQGDEAVVLYRTHSPREGDICTQVVTRPTASTFVDAKYRIRIAGDHTVPLSRPSAGSAWGAAPGGDGLSPDGSGGQRP